MDNKIACLCCLGIAIIVLLYVMKKQNPIGGEYYHQPEMYHNKRPSVTAKPYEDYEAIHTTPYSRYKELILKHPSELTTIELEEVISLDGINRSPGLIDSNRAAAYHAMW